VFDAFLPKASPHSTRWYGQIGDGKDSAFAFSGRRAVFNFDISPSRPYSHTVNDVTRILGRVQQGDSKAPEELLPLVYEELRKFAVAKMASQPAGHTLQATALVHEAWLRLECGEQQQWESRRHFYAAAAQAMRHILIERARKKQRIRHGAELARVDLDEVEIAAPVDDERLLEMNAALDELALIAPEKAEVVKLRFFVGLDENETGDLLRISPRTVERYWSYAKAWLFERIARGA
jgi:RNA polymerase sigma factor (TIGR02999 family)